MIDPRPELVPLAPALPSPLADLHRHLDGSIRPATLAELAARAGVQVPADLAFCAGMGLSAALSRFTFTLSLLQAPETVRRIAAEMCEDAAAEQVSTLEIRFAPQLHNRGAPGSSSAGFLANPPRSYSGLWRRGESGPAWLASISPGA